MQLINSTERQTLATLIKSKIDAYCQTTYNDGFRNHLGASLIGHDCNRYLWYTFRWVMASQHSGRAQRLFNRGHETEPRFIEWLRGIGFQVWDKDENGNQFRIAGVQGHFGGSLDSIGLMPAEYRYNNYILIEFKTHNEKSFAKFAGTTKTKAQSVKECKPQHYAQMCKYGEKMGFKYALYCAINKNNDDIYLELVELDWNWGAELERRAEYVITSQTPPPRLKEDPTYFVCQMCDFHPVCHSSGQYDKNCRSCINAVPVADAQWFCQGYGQVIPPDVIKVGCQAWKPVGRR